MSISEFKEPKGPKAPLCALIMLLAGAAAGPPEATGVKNIPLRRLPTKFTTKCGLPPVKKILGRSKRRGCCLPQHHKPHPTMVGDVASLPPRQKMPPPGLSCAQPHIPEFLSVPGREGQGDEREETQVSGTQTYCCGALIAEGGFLHSVDISHSRWSNVIKLGYSPGTAVWPRKNHMQLDGEDGSLGNPRKGRLELDRFHRSDSSFCWGNEKSIKKVQIDRFVKIVDRFSSNLSFVFVVYFVRAHLRGASLGTRLSGDMDRS